ncbi:MAG: hypothetical protein NC299_03850 [Lachnospiraceae bacterium]|nr:hypothetical protein [Ruminococcus sp.]MCM1274480.1 hypothetical protein [Lachnospiraceae bacterium]
MKKFFTAALTVFLSVICGVLGNAPSCAIAAFLIVLAVTGWTLPIEDFAAALAVVLPMLALMFIAPTMLLSELLWLGVAALRKRRSR